ncbi:MAG TPA: 50S ribosomal protein L11 methyltransferase, partial [Bacteroidales bacterium]|nr:50S ribosomal protein L11 methyltransferase [Bacteroidales bacterium]
MEYVEVQIEGFEASASESLVAALLGIDYDSFSEEDNHFRAYIPASAYNEERLKELLSSLFPDQQVRFTVCKLEDKDWNAEWERNYQPVLIAGKCMIRAPFHPAVAGVQY